PGAAQVQRCRGAGHLSGSAMLDGRLAADAPMETLDAPSTVAAMRTALAQASEAIVQQLRQLPPPGK
ncbi:MAG: hypothetical protein OSA97_13345, partial [Nevskia sp.]|nr:hypothetical protein [Nevskia sp.]